MSAPDPAPLSLPVTDPDTLQFQRAEYAGAGPDCAYCKKPAGASYFQVGQAIACPGCCEQLCRLQAKPDRGAMVRAALYGLGAAIAGSVLFALVSMTGFQFSIIAILVGYMVGKAMMKATYRRSSRACQVIAVVLTYGAITTSYLPSMIKGFVKAEKKIAARKSGDVAPPPTPGPINPARAVAGLGAAVALLVAMSFAVPFFVLAHSPLSGLINLVIIFIGLSKAWRLTTPFRAPITGPYTPA